MTPRAKTFGAIVAAISLVVGVIGAWPQITHLFNATFLPKNVTEILRADPDLSEDSKFYLWTLAKGMDAEHARVMRQKLTGPYSRSAMNIAIQRKKVEYLHATRNCKLSSTPLASVNFLGAHQFNEFFGTSIASRFEDAMDAAAIQRRYSTQNDFALHLFIHSESIKNKERRYWGRIDPQMTDQQIENLFCIFAREATKLGAIDVKYSDLFER